MATFTRQRARTGGTLHFNRNAMQCNAWTQQITRGTGVANLIELY